MLADAYLAAALVLVCECVVVVLWRRGQFGHPFELGAGLLDVLPVALVAAVPIALGGAALLLATDSERTGSWRSRLVVVVAAVALAAPVAWGVSGGRHLAGARRPAFIAVVVLCAMAATFWGSPLLGRAIERAERYGARWLVLATVVVVVALELINAVVLVRLYPAFHIGLAVLTLWVAAPLRALWRGRGAWQRIAAGAVTAALGLVLGFGAPGRLRTQDNVRLIFSDSAPLLSQAVRLTAWVAPPEAGVDEFVAAAQPTHSLDLSGRDLLLVTIDAVRADHVGSYGYARNTTPAIDALGDHGAVFEAAYTATPHTSYAVSSLMTGKYMRSLMRQAVGGKSETWAKLLRQYGYRTAAFYPPAVFFVDRAAFEHYERSAFDFEYSKVQFSGASERVEQVKAYLGDTRPDERLFIWVHLFEPHEPYVPHDAHPFGDRNIDRYDAEIAAADAALGEIVAMVRRQRPRTVVMVSADHGEEFGDHGGRYHGTTVYDEQVRVPLVINAPGLVEPRRISEAVSLVDLLPTVLGGLRIPISPRVRGRDLGPLLTGEPDSVKRFAFSETNEHTLFAQDALRLICARKLGACRLYDTSEDAGQRTDVSAAHVTERSELRRKLRAFTASMGRFEIGEGERWPQALRRGIAGDVDATLDVAGLLDDADVAIRQKAAEVLFELGQDDAAPGLRRALAEDEDPLVRRWCALALTRIGQGAPLTLDLLTSDEPNWRRLAALALAEAGDDRGEELLIAWWRQAYPEKADQASETIPYDRARQVIAALAHLRSTRAVGPLSWGFRDVRLRVHVAKALETIGDEKARPMLAAAFAVEPYHDARAALAQALVALGAGGEIRDPLVRFMGVPDPLPGALAMAEGAGLLAWIGGPRKLELQQIRRFATSGVAVQLVVPEGGNGTGLRAFVRARAKDDAPGEVRVAHLPGPPALGDRKELVPNRAPALDLALTARMAIPPSAQLGEFYGPLPDVVTVRPGEQAYFGIYATQNVEVASVAIVPLADELGP